MSKKKPPSNAPRTDPNTAASLPATPGGAAGRQSAQIVSGAIHGPGTDNWYNQMNPAQRAAFNLQWRQQYGANPGPEVTSGMLPADALPILRAVAPRIVQTQVFAPVGIEGEGGLNRFSRTGKLEVGSEFNSRLQLASSDQMRPESGPYNQFVMRDAAQFGVPWQILWAVVNAKTGFGLEGKADNPMVIIDQMAAKLRDSYKIHKDWSLAVLDATGREAQAATLARTGTYDPKTAAQDMNILKGVFGDAQKLGWQSNIDDKMVAGDATASAGGGGGGGVGTVAPDPEALKRFAADTVRSLLFREPSPEEVDKIVANVNQALVGSTAHDFNTRIENAVQGTAEFHRLYANMPDYLKSTGGPQQYSGQFVGQGKELLGTAPSGEAVRAGLETGDVGTTAGYVAGEAGAEKSSTFRQNLYERTAFFNKLV